MRRPTVILPISDSFRGRVKLSGEPIGIGCGYRDDLAAAARLPRIAGDYVTIRPLVKCG
jgi:hypothetical protein